MRVALGQGMHTDMPVDQLGDRIVERSRRIWWTVYVLDREMTSLMGLPQSVHDDDIHPALPHYGGSTQRVAALHMQIRLCRSIASVGRGMMILTMHLVYANTLPRSIRSKRSAQQKVPPQHQESPREHCWPRRRITTAVSSRRRQSHQWCLTSSGLPPHPLPPMYRARDKTFAPLLPQDSLRNTRRHNRGTKLISNCLEPDQDVHRLFLPDDQHSWLFAKSRSAW